MMAVVKTCNCCHELKEHSTYKSYTCNGCLDLGLKWCPSCKTVKPIEDFYKRDNKPASYCKECESRRTMQSKVNNQYYDRPEVKERMRIHRQQYRGTPEFKERNRIQSAEYKRMQYATEEGRQRELIRCHNRRAKIKGTVTLAEWKETLDYFDNSCAYCGSTDKITQDHIVPIASGGLNTKYNLVPACRSCNCSKNSKPLVQWYMKQPFATEERLQKVLDFMNKGGDANVI